jgi:hypothetical protein
MNVIRLLFSLTLLSALLFFGSCGSDSAPEPPPTIAAPTVTGLFQPEGQLQINFTITGKFTSGNIFTAQLSDGSGSFTTPTSIGTLNATAAGTINATLPSTVANGTAYRIRVVASAPSTTSPDNGSNLSIAAPTITISSFTTSPSANRTYIAGRDVALTITTTGTFASDNQFTIEVSNTAGTYNSSLGSITASTLTSRTVTLPTGIPTGTGFRFKITSTKPAVTSTFSSTFEVVALAINGFAVGANPNYVAGGVLSASFFAANGPWLSNNQFVLQLSDATGSFTSPIQLATTTSTDANPFFSSVFIPTTVPAGAGYRMRVVSTSPVVIGTATSAINIGALPTLTIQPATPVFTKMYSGSLFGTSYFFKLTKTGTFNPNSTFTIEMSQADQPFGSTIFSYNLTANNLTELNNTGTTNVSVSSFNLGNGNRRFRAKATGHAVQSSELIFPVTQTGVSSMSGTIESVNYTLSNNRGIYNTNTSGIFNNQVLYATGEATSSLYTEASLKIFIGLNLSNENLTTGATQTCSVIVHLLNSTGQQLAIFTNNNVTVNISGNASAYTATIGSVTLNRVSGSVGNTTLAIQSLSSSFKFQ